MISTSYVRKTEQCENELCRIQISIPRERASADSQLIHLRRSMASLNSGQNWVVLVLKRAWHARLRSLAGRVARFVRDSTAREPIKERRREQPRQFFTADKPRDATDARDSV